LDALSKNKLSQIFSHFHQEYSNFLTPLLIVNQGKLATTDFFQQSQDKFTVFNQNNFGGTGGFTRGILEARKIGATHILLMDDDAVPDENSFEKTLKYYLENEERMEALGGTRFSSEDPEKIHEAGAWVKPENFTIVKRLAGHKISTKREKIEDDLALHQNMNIDYGAWWFFACPMRAVEKVGLPLPLFIHRDDSEYGLRLKKAGIPTIPLPGLRIWHPESGNALKQWYAFFSRRNALIEKALHTNVSTPRLAFELAIKYFYYLLGFQYDNVDFLAKGILAYLKGPEALEKNPRTDFENSRMLMGKWPITLSSFDSETMKEMSEKTNPLWKEIMFVFLLNGLLFPAKREKDGKFPIFTHADNICFLVYRHSVYGVGSKSINMVKIYRRKPKALFKMTANACWTVLFFLVRNPIIKKRWRKNFPKLTTPAFWENYLGL
jgi:GT2 family glycosyltransferase